VGAKRGGQSPAGPRHCSWAIPGPHCHLWTIILADGGVPETSQNGWGRVLQGERDQGSTVAIGSRRTGWGIAAPPAGQSVDITGGWARKMAGSSRVSGAMVHQSKRGCDRQPDAEYG